MYSTTSLPPIHEREILVRASKDLTFKIYQKAYDASTTEKGKLVCRSAAVRTSYGLFTVFRNARPQVTPSLDNGSPLFTRRLFCISTRGKAICQQYPQSV